MMKGGLSALKDLINNKRKAAESLAGETKFIRLADVAAAKREEEAKKQKEAVNENASSSGTIRANTDAILQDVKDIPRPEVIKKLRERNQAVRLFGESDRDALIRLRKIEVEQPDIAPGWNNEYQQALNRAQEEVLHDMVKGSYGKKDNARNDEFMDASDDTWATITERCKTIGMNDGNTAEDCLVIHDFLLFVLSRWKQLLDARTLDEKTSPSGQLEFGSLTQTMADIRPLLKNLKKNCVNSDIRCHLVNITRLIMLDKNYILANNAYMELSIGNAPWPVGVTRSGIHQRPGSSKSYVSNIAHVLNHESQRKYIHGVKRVLTKCQDYFTADPSKCVEFVKKGP